MANLRSNQPALVNLIVQFELKPVSLNEIQSREQLGACWRLTSILIADTVPSEKKGIDPGIDSSPYKGEVMRATPEIKATILSGELARLTGVSTDTLRYYERKRVLPRPVRSRSGYRCYSASSVDRVKLIRAAIGIGIKLDELASIVQERDRGGVPCKHVFSLARRRLAELEERIQQLNSCRAEMQKIVTTWQQILSTASPSSRVNLLESIADRPSGLDREATSIRNLHPLKEKKGKS